MLRARLVHHENTRSVKTGNWTPGVGGVPAMPLGVILLVLLQCALYFWCRGKCCTCTWLAGQNVTGTSEVYQHQHLLAHYFMYVAVCPLILTCWLRQSAVFTAFTLASTDGVRLASAWLAERTPTDHHGALFLREVPLAGASVRRLSVCQPGCVDQRAWFTGRTPGLEGRQHGHPGLSRPVCTQHAPPGAHADQHSLCVIAPLTFATRACTYLSLSVVRSKTTPSTYVKRKRRLRYRMLQLWSKCQSIVWFMMIWYGLITSAHTVDI